MNTTSKQLTYSVPGVSCGHCVTAITSEVRQIGGVREVNVDVDAKRVTVTGTNIEDSAVRDAIDTAGYDVA